MDIRELALDAVVRLGNGSQEVEIKHGSDVFVVEPWKTPRGPGYWVEHVGPVDRQHNTGMAQSARGIVRIISRVLREPLVNA